MPPSILLLTTSFIASGSDDLGYTTDLKTTTGESFCHAQMKPMAAISKGSPQMYMGVTDEVEDVRTVPGYRWK